MRVHIGCSGFSYLDWKGVFYPGNLERGEFITYYSKYFDVVELNFSFYSFPRKSVIKSLLSKAKNLKFSTKAHRSFTHYRNYTEESAKRFLESIGPLLEEDRLIALLFQFPESFHYNQENLDYIKKLSKDFKDTEKVIEVRSKSFKRASFYEFLEEIGFSLANTDAPKEGKFLVGPWRPYGNVNYVRLHGRDPERLYDYLYSLDELKELKDKIKKLSNKDTYIFFNNTARAQAVYNALQMKLLFGIKVQIPKTLEERIEGRVWE